MHITFRNVCEALKLHYRENLTSRRLRNIVEEDGPAVLARQRVTRGITYGGIATGLVLGVTGYTLRQLGADIPDAAACGAAIIPIIAGVVGGLVSDVFYEGGQGRGAEKLGYHSALEVLREREMNEDTVSMPPVRTSDAELER